LDASGQPQWAGRNFQMFERSTKLSPPPTGAPGQPASAAPTPGSVDEITESDVPARLDRLPWGSFHTLVVTALGVTWILDGLEVTLAGSLAGALKQSPVLHFSNTDVGFVSSVYLVGAVSGALLFGWLTDRWGRKKLFFVTLAVYSIAGVATAFSWDLLSFAVFRFFAGAGIGGEYAAINSAIQELIPARYRGRTDLAVNGSYWLGAAVGAAGSIVFLDPMLISPEIGWRLAFFIGASLGLVIVFMRLWLPESPRWLMTHGRNDLAHVVLAKIEDRFRRGGVTFGGTELARVRLRTRRNTPLLEALDTLFHTYRRRTLVGLTLMGAQAFFYNAIFFTYALILTDFYGVRPDQVGWYVLPFAVGNFIGPLLLGPLFDTVGRKPMITATYAISGLLLAGIGYVFSRDAVSVSALTAGWVIVFFFASAAASSAYLTVGEIFPLEIRALAIAFFYAVGTGIGGVAGPWLFGALIDTGSRTSVFIGYLIGAFLMIVAASVQALFGVATERQPLEAAARPLTFIE
jgi:MFS family permease